MEMNSKISPHVLDYIEMIERGNVRACREQHDLVALVREAFDTEDIYTDDALLEKCLGLARYFDYEKLFEWEEFVFALHKCTFRTEDKRPRWPDLFLFLGRGAGKDGYIAFDSFASVSPYYGIPGYDVDICANNEEQAMTPFLDVWYVLESPFHTKKLRKHFRWNRETIEGIKTKGKIKGRTNNAKGKDGLRSGQVTFNEVHQYESWDNINVFTTGLGKKKHPRRLYATTDGDVREGPLDELKARAERILKGSEPDNGFLPFICKLDSKEEVHDPANWEKANPSLRYRPDLMAEIEKEYSEWKESPGTLTAFMTKRMNIPDSDAEKAITDWANIKATNKPMKNLEGCNCVAGIDYMKVTDFASVDLHFKDGDIRYDINHSWICTNSKDIPRIKAPWRQWAQEGLLTVVDDIEIHPDLISEYVFEMGKRHNIEGLAMDNYRYTLLSNSLRDYGWDVKDRKNVRLVRPSDIMRIVPVIDSCFVNQYFVWGDNPVLRWGANNTKLVRAGKKMGTDTGNMYYAKIEGRSRKTDPFMALVAAMTIEEELTPSIGELPDIGAFIF